MTNEHRMAAGKPLFGRLHTASQVPAASAGQPHRSRALSPKAPPQGHKSPREYWRTCSVLCLGALILAGCSTTDKGSSGQTASVVIRGNTPGQIGAAVTEVFEKDGYQLARKRELVFEKEGSNWSNLAYGNWISETRVWMRVKVSIVPVGEATCRLECTAFLVRDKGESTEEELKVRRRSPYQKLLDEVAARFKPSPVS